MFKNNLMGIGIFPNLSGFNYLNDAIEMWEGPKSKLGKIEDTIAKKYNVKNYNVERDMRYAITKYTTNSGSHLTIGNFISMFSLLWKNDLEVK